MFTIAYGPRIRTHRLRTVVTGALVAAALGGCGASGQAGSSATVDAAASPLATTTSVTSALVVPASTTSASATSASATSASATSAGLTSASTARPVSPRSTVASPQPAKTGRTSGAAVYDRALRRLSATFGTASSQFIALADGAVPAEIGAAAPTFAAAAATFAHSLTSLHPPVGATDVLSQLETQLKLLSLELTRVADDTQTQDLTAAKTALTAAARTDLRILALAKGLT